MPQLDLSTYSSMIFWLFVCLGMVVFFYVRYVLPRYNATIENRLHTIRFDLEQSHSLNEQADVLLKTCDAKIAQAKLEADINFQTACVELDEKINRQLIALQGELSDKRKHVENARATEYQALQHQIAVEVDKATQIVCEALGYKNITTAKERM